MWTHMVVPESELPQRQDKVISALDLRGPELGLQRAEQALDASFCHGQPISVGRWRTPSRSKVNQKPNPAKILSLSVRINRGCP
jgi:hypothetical protein